MLDTQLTASIMLDILYLWMVKGWVPTALQIDRVYEKENHRLHGGESMGS